MPIVNNMRVGNLLSILLSGSLLLMSGNSLILADESIYGADGRPSGAASSQANLVDFVSNSQTENIAIGNTNNNHFNIDQSHYVPTQLTQVVLNVPKPKKLRISRPPTEEEFSIKRKILSIYESIPDELRILSSGVSELGHQQRAPVDVEKSINFQQLGRVIQALNPKYISTERVRRVAFGNPLDPTTLIPFPSVQPEPLSKISLNIDGNAKPISDQLDALNRQFRAQVSWDLAFLNSLISIADNQLDYQQLAFKRLLLCLTQQAFCEPAAAANQQQVTTLIDGQQQVAELDQNQTDGGDDVSAQFGDQQGFGDELADATASASTVNQVYSLPPPLRSPQQLAGQQQQSYLQQPLANQSPVRPPSETFRNRYSQPSWIYQRQQPAASPPLAAQGQQRFGRFQQPLVQRNQQQPPRFFNDQP